MTQLAKGGKNVVEALPPVGLSANIRRVSERPLRSSNEVMGIEPASPELIKAIESKGRTVVIAKEGSEDLRYLDAVHAEASVGGPGRIHILLRENASQSAVLEEFLHGTQDRLGIIDRLGEPGAEAHVKRFMIRHRKMLGLSNYLKTSNSLGRVNKSFEIVSK